MTKKIRNGKGGDEVLAEFAERRHRINRSAVLVGIIVGAISLVAYRGGMSNAAAGILLAAAFLWALSIHRRIWRCPACNGHLGRLYLGLKLPKFCPECGVRLIEE